MRCLEASELMSLRLDSNLSSQEEQALQEHLLTCEGCRAEWEAMQRASALFHGATLAAPAPDLFSRVMGGIRLRDLRLAILRNSLFLLLGAVILTALALSLWTTVASPVGAILDNPPLISAVASIVVGLFDLVGTLLRAMALVLRTILACPSSVGLVGYVAAAGALALWWIRLVSGRTRLVPGRKTS